MNIDEHRRPSSDAMEVLQEAKAAAASSKGGSLISSGAPRAVQHDGARHVEIRREIRSLRSLRSLRLFILSLSNQRYSKFSQVALGLATCILSYFALCSIAWSGATYNDLEKRIEQISDEELKIFPFEVSKGKLADFESYIPKEPGC